MNFTADDRQANLIQNIALKQTLAWGFDNVTMESIAEEAGMMVNEVRDIAGTPQEAVMGVALDGLADLVTQVVQTEPEGHLMDRFFGVYEEWSRRHEKDPIFNENQSLLYKAIDESIVLQGAFHQQLVERAQLMSDLAATMKGWDSGDLRANIMGSLVNSFLIATGEWLLQGNARNFADALSQSRAALDDIIVEEDMTSTARERIARQEAAEHGVDTRESGI